MSIRYCETKQQRIYLQIKLCIAGIRDFNCCAMICLNFLQCFDSTFKLNSESDSNLKPQQICIISCSLWKGNRVDIEHWSLKLQFCCSIIHDATEWYILATSPCSQTPLRELPLLHFSAAENNIINCKCVVNNTHLKIFTMIMCQDRFSCTAK